MAPNKFTSLFVAVVLLFSVVATGSTIYNEMEEAALENADNHINPLCEAAGGWLCSHMVDNATNWHDAAVNAITYSLKTLEDLNAMEQELKHAMAAVHVSYQKQILHVCTTDLKKALDALKSSLVAIKTNDAVTVASKLEPHLNEPCYVKLQLAKKRGFDQDGQFFRLLSMVKPAIEVVVALMKLKA